MEINTKIEKKLKNRLDLNQKTVTLIQA